MEKAAQAAFFYWNFAIDHSFRLDKGENQAAPKQIRTSTAHFFRFFSFLYVQIWYHRSRNGTKRPQIVPAVIDRRFSRRFGCSKIDLAPWMIREVYFLLVNLITNVRRAVKKVPNENKMTITSNTLTAPPPTVGNGRVSLLRNALS